MVAQNAMALLTDEVIEELADMAIAQTEQDLKENTRIPELTERKKEVTKSIENITRAIEKGIASDTLMNRLVELEKEAKHLDTLLQDEERYIFRIDRWQIIDLMVNSVTVWDEPDGYRITTAYNLTSTKNRTYRVSSKADSTKAQGFGFEGLKSTKTDRSL